MPRMCHVERLKMLCNVGYEAMTASSQVKPDPVKILLISLTAMTVLIDCDDRVVV